MKKLLLSLLVACTALTSFSQGNVDAGRVNVRTNFTMPFLDTLAAAIKIGEERTRPQDSLVYYWQGLRWIAFRNTLNIKDTIPLFHIGTGAPALRPIYALNGALRASNWGGGYGWVPRLLGDSTMVGDVDTTSIAYKQWVINQFSPGGAFAVSFNNGTILSGSIAGLGGSLVRSTTITQAAFTLALQGNPANGNQVFSVQALGTTGNAANFSNNSATFPVLLAFNGGTGPGLFGASAGGPALSGQSNDANTNTVIPLIYLSRSTTAVAAAGLGQSIQFNIQTASPTSGVIANTIESKWSNAISATATSVLTLYGVNSLAPTTLITFNGNGQGIMSNTVPNADLFSVSNTEPTLNNTAIRGTSINGAGVVGSSTSGTGVIGTSTSGFGGAFSSTSGSGISAVSNSSSNQVALFTLVPATTNTVRTVATFNRNTIGTATNGIGSAIELFSQTTTSTVAGTILQNILTDATGAAPTSQYSIKGNNASSAQSLLWTLDGNGNVTMTGGIILRAPLLTAAGTYTILANDYEVVFTGTTTTWTLPAHVAGRSLKLVNQGTGSITSSVAITTASGVTTTTITAGSNFIIDDDGTNWRKTN